MDQKSPMYKDLGEDVYKFLRFKDLGLMRIRSLSLRFRNFGLKVTRSQ